MSGVLIQDQHSFLSTGLTFRPDCGFSEILFPACRFFCSKTWLCEDGEEAQVSLEVTQKKPKLDNIIELQVQVQIKELVTVQT